MQVDAVRELAGAHRALQAALHGAVVRPVGPEVRGGLRIALHAGHEHVGGEVARPRVAATGRRRERPVRGEVILGFGQQVVALRPGELPVLRDAMACPGRPRDVNGVVDAKARGALRRFVVHRLVAGIYRGPQLAAPVVHGQRRSPQLDGLALGGGLPVTVDAVEAHTPLVVVAEPAAHVQVAAQVALGQVSGSQAGQRHIARPLGHQVDGAAHRAARPRRHAVEQRVGALEHLDALGRFDRHGTVGGDAADPVEQHRVLHREAADQKDVAPRGSVRQAVGHRAHGRVVGQHIGHGDRLLVLHEFGRVAGDVKRRVHQALRTQQADPAARGDLAAGIGGRQIAGRCLGAGRHGDRAQGGGIAEPGCLRCRARCLAQREDAARGLPQLQPRTRQRAAQCLGCIEAAPYRRRVAAFHQLRIGGEGQACVARDAVQGSPQWPDGQVVVAHRRSAGRGRGGLCRGWLCSHRRGRQREQQRRGAGVQREGENSRGHGSGSETGHVRKEGQPRGCTVSV
ncbi:hypothetical protein D3C71_1100320 [compost metagenome]